MEYRAVFQKGVLLINSDDGVHIIYPNKASSSHL